MLNYENGKYAYITRLFDKGNLSLSIQDYRELTHLQKLCFIFMNNECVRFRSENKAFLTF